MQSRGPFIWLLTAAAIAGPQSGKAGSHNLVCDVPTDENNVF